MNEFEALTLIALVAFLGGYVLRLIHSWASHMRDRRRLRAAEIKAKRKIWPRWA